MTRMMLGTQQKEMLLLLNDMPNATWSTLAGWRNGTHANTEKLLKSLQPHGLVEETGQTPDRFAIFQITDAGRAKAKAIRSRK